MPKINTLLWNELFHGRIVGMDRFGEIKRIGGIIKAARIKFTKGKSQKLKELSGELKLIVALLESAGKDRDAEFIDKSEPYCKLLGIDFEYYKNACSDIWEIEDGKREITQ